MLRSLKDGLKFLLNLAAVEFTGTTATTGVDCQHYRAVTFLVNAGVEAGNALSSSHKIALTVQHADVDVNGSYANCVDADIFNAEDGANGVAKYLDATSDASALHQVHYRGNKRWVRLNLVETGTVDMPLAVSVVALPKEMPAL